MKLGVMPSFTRLDASALPALLAQVEALGCESVWMPEHVVVPLDYTSRYPYNATGRMYTQAEDDVPDPLDWLAYAAACTEQVQLGTALLVLPEHNPVVLAKRLATVDVLSHGRLLAGIGVGWLREEFESVGVGFARRGDRADEYLRAMRCLWSEEVASFRGEYVSFEDVACRPRPTRSEGVPVVIGGSSRAAARRAVRYGNGFFPLAGSVDGLRAAIRALHEECDAHERDRLEVGVSVFAPDSAVAMHELAELDIRRIVLPVPFTGVEALVDTVERYRDEFGRVLEKEEGPEGARPGR